MANNQLARNSFKGKMNKDLDPINIQGQDYIDALNVQFLSDATGNTLNIMPVIGNRLAFDLGSVVAQNKKYRIYIPDTGNYEIKIFNIDKTTPYNPTGIPVAPIPFTDITDFQVSIATSLSNSGISFQQTVNITDMYVEVEITETPYYDYIIDSIGVDSVEIKISQESIDPSLAGFKRVIGSNDLLGELFIFSTPCTTLPEEFEITNISNNGSGLIRITTSSFHGLQDYEYVSIFGAPQNTGAAGVWQVDVISATQFDLILSTFTNAGTTGTVRTKFQSVGEIGVALFDPNADTWSYTRLLASKELGFTTKHQIDCDSESGGKYDINIYYTDNFNTPRVFYYNKPYSQDGAISVYDSSNIYSYGFIDNESYLFVKNDYLEFSFVSQLDSGGSLSPGNKYYTYRLITDTNAYTDWGLVSGPIPVYSASISDPSQVLGDDELTTQQTGKINVISYSGIDTETYSFIEVAVVEYLGLATSASIIGRFNITGNSIEIQHTGSELATDLSISDIISKKSNFTKAKNVRIIDNRLTLSNLEIDQTIDLSAWAKTFKHSIKRKQQQDINGLDSDPGNAKFPEIGSYKDPYVVNTQVGYCLNETDRFSVVGITKKGYRTQPFWVDDIKFDTNPINTANPFGDNRRNSTIPDFNLTTQSQIQQLPYNQYVDNESTVPYVFYVSFENINIDFELDNGKKVSDIIERIEFWRCENVQEVYSGVFMYWPRITSTSGVIAPNGQTINSWYQEELPVINNPNAGTASNFKIGKFYSIDTLLTDSSIKFDSGNTYLNILGVPKGMFYQSQGTDAAIFECFSDVSIPSQAISVYNPIPTNIPILTLLKDTPQYDPQATGGTLIKEIGSEYYNFYTQIRKPMISPPVSGYGMSSTGFIIELNNSGIINTNDYNKRVDLYAQVITPIQNKYGDIKLSSYIPTQSSYVINSINNQSSLDVFGGYCFTQKNYIRPVNKSFVSAQPPDHSFVYSFFSQNRVNSEMRFKGDETATPPQYVFPAISQGVDFDEKLDLITKEGHLEFYGYFDSYTPVSKVDNTVGYNEDLDYQEKLPTRIIWSSLKPTGSNVDYYRVFLPFQFKDVNMKWGEIIHHENVNDQLFLWQPRNWQREFFNTTGMLQSSDSDLIVLGNAGVMARQGQRISAYGTNNKWSVVKGRTRGGGDQLFWINEENGAVIRFGADGTNTISLMWGMFSYFNNNLKWAGQYDTPADGEGIAGVWNERYQEAIYSVRGYRKLPEWTIGQTYQVGTAITRSTVKTPVYEFPQIYVCNQPNTASPSNRPGGPASDQFWDKISTDDNNYYNLYSFVISEVKNGFTSFLSPKPLIYLPWRNKYLTPHPSELHVSKLYEENIGDYCTWYKINNTEVSEDGYIESVINLNPMDVKTFIAILSQSEYKPHRIEFAIDLRDSNQNLVELRTYLTENDFEYREGVWVSPIKNDTTTAPNGTPDEDTTQMFGNYIKVKIFIEKKKFQKLQNYLIKLQVNSRYTQT